MNALLNDPAALHAAWRQALQAHPHLHGPEAAARLGVPEAALLASATGHGNLRLAGGLGEVLAPVADWGRVLVATRNRLGVKLDVLGQAALGVEADGSLRLHDAQHEILLAVDGIASLHLFEEHDHHGHTLSLNWFDAHGEVIGRLFLMSKSGREQALPHLQGFALALQVRDWRPGEMAPPPLMTWALDAAPGGPLPGRAAHWAAAAIRACDSVPRMRLSLAGPGARSRYEGPLNKCSSTPPAVHATDLLCKLHARTAPAQQARRLGDAMVVLDPQGGQLLLEPLQDAATWWSRVEALNAEEALA